MDVAVVCVRSRDSGGAQDIGALRYLFGDELSKNIKGRGEIQVLFVSCY